MIGLVTVVMVDALCPNQGHRFICISSGAQADGGLFHGSLLAAQTRQSHEGALHSRASMTRVPFCLHDAQGISSSDSLRWPRQGRDWAAMCAHLSIL